MVVVITVILAMMSQTIRSPSNMKKHNISRVIEILVVLFFIIWGLMFAVTAKNEDRQKAQQGRYCYVTQTGSVDYSRCINGDGLVTPGR